MKFHRIHIDGFGVWHDLHLEDLGAGLNVLAAPNEGGKSTLMAFIRAVLFGFKRRGDARRYEPLKGGRHGGALEVEAGGVRYRIERTESASSRGDVTVTDADGNRFGEAKLESLLRSTSETLYENVFAFGLDELQQLDSLQAEDVAGHIYSAGMGSGALSPVAFRAEMEGARDALFLPRGKKQPVTKLMAEIEAQEERIEQLRQSLDRHSELTRQHRRLRERLGELDAQLERARRGLETAQRTQRAWTHYETLLEAESTLDTIGVTPDRLHEQLRASNRTETVELGPVEGAPAAGASRRSAATAVAVQEVAAADPAELMSSAHRTLLGHAKVIRGLIATARRIEELRETVVERQAEARELRHLLFNDLEELGDRWSLDRVRKAATDIKARDLVRQWRERLDRGVQEIESAEQRADDANLVYEAMRENREQITRGSLLVSWGLIVLAVAATATLVPPPATLTATVSIGVVGGLLAILVTWLHARGLRQRRSEQAVAARREADLWQQHDQARESLEEIRREWRQWLVAHQLPDELSTQGALDLLDRLRQTQDKDQRATDAEAAVTRATADLQKSCMEVVTVLEEIDRQSIELRYDPLKMVDPLLSTLEALQSELDDVEQHRERVRRGLDDHARARAALRALAGDEGLETLRRKLESNNPDRLAAAVGEAQGKVRQAQADRDALHENLGGLREQIAALESDRELAELLQARESRRTSLREAVEDWASHALAVALYDEAKRKYEAERQPEVLKLASRYFEHMTDGRYTRVIAPLGENRVEVERETGERLETAALSRGTSEQLYLAMRLALARVYGNEATPLPLVADDILVNFDDDRARATASLLDFYASEGHQVLAFTCHRHLVNAFERHAPGVRVQTLPAHS